MTAPRDPAGSYRRDKVAPRARFDEVETTMSHLFRRPHPALAGRSFGAALHAALSARGLLSRGEAVELGGGAGFVAAAMAGEAQRLGQPWRHTFFDLSEPLLELQRRQLPGAGAVVASAERLPLPQGGFEGLFLANEVIADLRVAPASSPEGKAVVDRYRLDAPPGSLINLGALTLVEELARVMAPGASACLTEFGGDFAPAAVSLEGPLGSGHHVEHSIHFGHLARAARALGLEAERVNLADLLGVNRNIRVASYADLLRLRRLVPSLPVLAFTQEELEARHPFLTRVFHFEFPQIGSPRFPNPLARSGFCQLFEALLLRRE